MVNFIQIIIKRFFFAQLHVITCPEMLEWSCLMERKRTCIFVLNVKLSAVNA